MVYHNLTVVEITPLANHGGYVGLCLRTHDGRIMPTVIANDATAKAISAGDIVSQETLPEADANKIILINGAPVDARQMKFEL